MDYKIVKYSEIGKIRSGKRLPKGYTVSEQKSDNKYIRVRDINNGSIDSSIVQYITDEAASKLERYRVKTRDVIISVVGTVGAIAQIDESLNGAYLTENCDNLQVDESLCLKDYLKYYLLSDDGNKEIVANTVGSTQPKLPIYGIENFNIKLPSIDNQKRIIKLLNSISKKVKLNNEINNNLYELGKALYKKYFKDLPADNTKKLGELCNIKYGKGLPTKKIEKEGYPVYGGNGIIGYYHEFMYDDSQVLISCRGAASGNVIVSKPKSFVTNNSLILESDRKYHHYLKQYSLDNYYYEYTTGSAQPQITIDNIKDIVLIIPSDELLEAFNKQMDSLELKAFANLEELEKLKKLRDTLLPKLMNGEIDLDNIEI